MSIAAFSALRMEMAREAQHEISERTGFEAFFGVWMQRVFAFASARLPERPDAEAVTRAALARALCEGIRADDERAAPRVLCIVKAEIERQRRSCGARA